MKYSALLAGTIVVLASSTAAAQATVQVYLGSTPVLQTAPEAAAVWASATPADPGLTSSSGAAASADLTAGTMRVFTDLYSTSPLSAGSGALQSDSRLDDILTFEGNPGQINVALWMTVDGAFSESHPLPQGARFDSSVSFHVALVTDGGNVITRTDATISRTIVDAGAPVVGLQPPPDGTSIVATLNSDETLMGPPYTVTVITTVMVPVGSEVSIDAEVSINSGTTTPGVEEAVDFGSTAKLSLVYPAGYTFTSKSGAFLSRPDAGGLSLDGGTGGPPGQGTGSTTGGGTSGGGTASGGTSGNGGSGSGGSGGSSSGGQSTASGGKVKPSGGCASVGADDTWASGLLCAGALLASRAARRRRRGSQASENPGEAQNSSGDR